LEVNDGSDGVGEEELSEGLPLTRNVPVVLPDAPARPADAALAGGEAYRGGAFAALHHRDFRLFYSGQILSLIGTWMQTTAQGWLVLELTNSEFLLGVVTAMGSLPVLLFSLYAGVVADRRDKRTIMLVAQSAALVLALILAVLTHTGLIGIGSILVLVFLLGVANAFEVPTRQSWFVELVGKRDLTNAIALNSSAFNLTRIIGPAVAGVMIGAVGIAACFYLNAVSYLAVVVVLAMIRPSRAQRAPAQGSVTENLREGFRFIWHHRLARTLVLLVAASSILAYPYAMLLPVFARDVLHAGATGLGWLLAATGAGALVGGIVLAAVATRVRRGRLLLSAAVAFCLMLLCFSFSRTLPLSLALLSLAGFAMIPFSATVNATLQSLIPDGLRGRVMSVYVFMFLGMTPLGALQAGAMARWLGAPAALALGAVALLAVVGTVTVMVPELREVR
jgi:MFS family permease